MTSDEPPESHAMSLSEMMSLDAPGGTLWAPEELGTILEHQLAAPLQPDLRSLDSGLVRLLGELNTPGEPPLWSFRDLLHHPSPPLGLLELTRQFAKACRNHPHSPLPDEIATVLYFLAIVVAMTRCSGRITKMDDRSLGYSLKWALRQPWLDDATRGILQEGMDAIEGSGPEMG